MRHFEKPRAFGTRKAAADRILAVGVKAQELTGVITFGTQCTSRFAEATKRPVRNGMLTTLHSFVRPLRAHFAIQIVEGLFFVVHVLEACYDSLPPVPVECGAKDKTR